MDAGLAERFRQAVPPVDFCSLRYVEERSDYLAVRQDVVQPVATSEDSGAMLTVYDWRWHGLCRDQRSEPQWAAPRRRAGARLGPA